MYCIKLHQRIEDTIDIRLLLIPWSTQNYKNLIRVFPELKGMCKMFQAKLSNEKCTGLIISCLQMLCSVALLLQLSKTVLITSNSWTNPVK